MTDAIGFVILCSEGLLLCILFISLLRSCLPSKETSVFRKIFFLILAFCATLAGQALTAGSLCLFAEKEFKEMLILQLSPASCRFLPATISCLIAYLLINGVKKLYRVSDNRLDQSETNIHSVHISETIALPFHSAHLRMTDTLLGCSMVIFLLLFGASWTCANRFVVVSFCVITIILCFLNHGILHILAKLNHENRSSFEETLIRQQNSNQLRLDELSYQYETLQKSRHDFKNVLCVIRNLNHERKHIQVEQYITSYMEHLQTAAAFVTTDNEYLNAIISAKASEARKHDIDVHIVISSKKQTVDSVDLCNMLGNMFDNAITACLKMKEGRKITLRIYDEGSETIFCMKNTILAPVLPNNPELQTEKKDYKNHGYGIRIIREIAQKHGGFADFYEEGNMFCCNVVLHLL